MGATICSDICFAYPSVFTKSQRLFHAQGKGRALERKGQKKKKKEERNCESGTVFVRTDEAQGNVVSK